MYDKRRARTVWIHGGGGVDKPCVDILGDIGRIVGRASEAPCDSVVKDRIRHGIKGTSIIDEMLIRIELPVSSDCTGLLRGKITFDAAAFPPCSPYLHRTQISGSVSTVVFPAWLQSGHA